MCSTILNSLLDLYGVIFRHIYCDQFSCTQKSPQKMVIGVGTNTFSSSTRNSARIREKGSERKCSFSFCFFLNVTVQ